MQTRQKSKSTHKKQNKENLVEQQILTVPSRKQMRNLQNNANKKGDLIFKFCDAQAFLLNTKLESVYSLRLIPVKKKIDSSNNLGQGEIKADQDFSIENDVVSENGSILINLQVTKNSQDDKILLFDSQNQKSKSDDEYSNSDLSQIQQKKKVKKSLKIDQKKENNQLIQKTINFEPLKKQSVKVQFDQNEDLQLNLQKEIQSSQKLNESQKLVQQLLDKLKNHESSFIFNCPLDPNHPEFENLKQQFQTLNLIDLQLKMGGKYANSDQLCHEIRVMIAYRWKIILSSYYTNLSELQVKIQDFIQFFESNFKGLEGLILEKPIDQKFIQKEKALLINEKIMKILKEKNEFKVDVQNKMTYHDFKQLQDNIRKLTKIQMRGLVQIVQKLQYPNEDCQNIFDEMIYKFDINELSDECINKVNDYLKFHVQLNERNRKKREADEIRKQHIEKLSLQEKRSLKLEKKTDSLYSFSGSQKQICNSLSQNLDISQIDSQNEYLSSCQLLNPLQLSQIVLFQNQNPQFLANQCSQLNLV